MRGGKELGLLHQALQAVPGGGEEQDVIGIDGDADEGGATDDPAAGE